MPRSRQILLLVLLVAIVGGGGYYWFVLRTPAETAPPVDPTAQPTPATTAGTPSTGSTATTPGATGTPAEKGAPNSKGAKPAGTGNDASGALQKTATQVRAADDSAVVSRKLSDGSASGNNAYAVKIAKIVADIAHRNGLNFEVQVQLVPGVAGMVTRPRLEAAYKSRVIGAVMRMKAADSTTDGQWAANKVKVRKNSIVSFLALLKKLFPNATRSVSVLAADDMLLGIGDAPHRGRVAVTVYPPTAASADAVGAPVDPAGGAPAPAPAGTAPAPGDGATGTGTADTGAVPAGSVTGQ